eukprot:TRINITY_DN12955_c0_g1_i1.p2 TRINITY_DN12955_c0_g1~~TRINITY_DN12955_c0_g1_i1.p2  ORF type:complete len:360 (+),score=66.77 TRINITY_DN12955_c0_g1_i1:68-1147(+)
MPSDDDEVAVAPTNGPDWEDGFTDALRRFEDDMRNWKQREQAAADERGIGRNLDQRAVASCSFAAEDCLKAQFPDRADDGDASPLQALHTAGRGQREELQQVLQMVREHAEQFEGHSELAEQLPQPGSASRRTSGSDVVALLAELLDVASRNLSKARKETSTSQRQKESRDDEEDVDSRREDRGGREPRNGRDGRDYRDGRDREGRSRDRDPPPPPPRRGERDRDGERDRGDRGGKDDYRRDERWPRDGGGKARGEGGARGGRDSREAVRGGRSRSRGGEAPLRRGGGGGKGGGAKIDRDRGDRDRGERDTRGGGDRRDVADRERDRAGGGRAGDRDPEGGGSSRRPRGGGAARADSRR